jgi:predicted N-acetyltransferase YhbS
LTREAPIRFAPESDETLALTDAVIARAFGPGRLAKTSERVREIARFAPDLSAVAFVGGVVAGCCRMSRIAIGDRPAVFLGPIAVEAELRGQQLGARLVTEVLKRVAADRVGTVLLIGSEAFFAPHGFVRVPAGTVRLPGPVDPARLLWRVEGETLAGAVTGSRAATQA